MYQGYTIHVIIEDIIGHPGNCIAFYYHAHTFLIPHSLYRHGHVLVVATQKQLCPDTRIPALALNGFSVTLFVSPAPKVLAEIKRIIYTALSPWFCD